MGFEYTKNAVDALNAASSCARQFGHDHIASEHIFLSILAIPSCSAVARFRNLGVSPEELSESMRNSIATAATTLSRGALPVTARTKKVLQIAEIEAKGAPVSTSCLIIAMLKEGENAAAQLLFNAGITLERFLSAGIQSSSQQEEEPFEENQASSENENSRRQASNGKQLKTPTLAAFGRDLTALASQGRLDPVIGRQTQLRRIVQILSRRTKNNAVLIGEAGVGKTAVVEGLALQIHRGEVPERMQGKRIVALDMARVVAGTQYRGQFEERLKKIVDETIRAGNVILFLDEIHTMVGAGGSEGSMDAANILKPPLARGELQCIGATTLKEYHRSIEKDAALERRFQSVLVDEPTIEDTIEILSGIAPKYEEFHTVSFAPEVLRSAVELTSRYLPARQLPDKAIDAMDETGARLRAAHSARPNYITDIQEKIDSLKSKKEEAVRRGDFDCASEYRSEIALASQEFADKLAKWKSAHAEEMIIATEADIAETVSLMSGVPVEKMNTSTAEKLLSLEKSLSNTVVGQDEAVAAVARALRRSRAMLGDPRRPVGGFLFLGPTGVGKTHLAKMLAEKVYGDEKSLITIDMSEFQEKYSSSRLTGAPPGYVGYEEGGQLTEKVRRRPYSVVLFDEFEKADSQVHNMLLQILDDGRLTDGQGRIVDFRNTIIICTANLGFDFDRGGRSLGFAPSAHDNFDALREKLLGESKRSFRPELLNRFDEVVVFKRLTKDDMALILDNELEKLSQRAAKVCSSITFSKDAKAFLVDKGFEDGSLGARPIKRAIRRFVEDPLAEEFLSGKLGKSVKVGLSKAKTRLEFSKGRGKGA
ncbi:MAG: ATP-dependent Clp protease ATP-binding subunit [Kiritimatiellae bacterium]|nr:ATP-dependent Clp protease ATP-binding subunit [Kiritimatiellia bacterium]